jgi:raffinose/stachyose/melibiose transport system substrate-binding protein
MRQIYFGFNQRILAFLIIMSFAFAGCAPTPVATQEPTQAPTPTKPPSEVTLTMGSWRTDDVEQMNRILAKFHEIYPHITVKFDPTTPPEYDAALQAQLENGGGPDVFYLRSYSVSRALYEKGYLEPLDAQPGLMENFTPEMRAPWATDDGKPYGVPFIATSHGVYYNADLFKQLNISIPATWQQLLASAQTIKDAGYIPFANASADTWTVAEIMFMNIAPDFIGGREGRMEYLDGKRCFNDANMTAVFQALKDIEPFLPPNQSVVTYSDSQQLFLQGKAAMFLDGSWDIPFFESSKPTFAWSIFAPPPPEGQPPYLTFHLDAGMGLNAASLHKEEARLFLEWMSTQEFASMLGNELPGFFPMHSKAPVLQNEHANTFLSLNQGRGTDVRFAWEKLRDGSPDAYTLIMDGAVAVLNDKQKPQEAADALQNGLAQWFAPAQTCKK